MKIYPFRASYPNAELISSADAFLGAVSKEYINYKNAGFFIKRKQKALFIYRITGKQTFTGIIAGNDILLVGISITHYLNIPLNFPTQQKAILFGQ